MCRGRVISPRFPKIQQDVTVGVHEKASLPWRIGGHCEQVIRRRWECERMVDYPEIITDSRAETNNTVSAWQTLYSHICGKLLVGAMLLLRCLTPASTWATTICPVLGNDDVSENSTLLSSPQVHQEHTRTSR